MEKQVNFGKQIRLIPLTEWPTYHPWPPVGGLRHLVFNADRMNFRHVFKKCGRRILIDEQAFFEYVEEQNAAKEKR